MWLSRHFLGLFLLQYCVLRIGIKNVLPNELYSVPFVDEITIRSFSSWYTPNFFLDICFFSYDGRNRPGTHAKNEVLLGQRAYFRTVTEPAALQIDNVSENDAGLYRCRVDFGKSPTRNSKVNLTVIGKYEYMESINFFFLLNHYLLTCHYKILRLPKLTFM